jgi:nicotinamidase-related amidase
MRMDRSGSRASAWKFAGATFCPTRPKRFGALAPRTSRSAMFGLVFRRVTANARRASQRFQKARENGWFQLGGWGTEVHEAAAPLPGDFDIVKHRVSPFYGTVLEPILSAQRIDTIFVSGVSTNAVVQAAMREGQDRDFRMVLIEDCCSALTPEEHEQALATLRSFGEVTTSTEINFRS